MAWDWEPHHPGNRVRLVAGEGTGQTPTDSPGWLLAAPTSLEPGSLYAP